MANTKSTSITNLDASPPIQPSGGQGAQAYLYEIDDHTAVTSGAAANDTFQVIRIPTHAMLKRLDFMSTAFAATAFAVNIGLNYSDNGPFDGSNPSNNGTAVGAGGATFFASAYSVGTSAMAEPVELTYAHSFVLGSEQQPLWQAAGLASDPGGFFDVVVSLQTVTGAVTAGNFYVRAMYVIAGAA